MSDILKNLIEAVRSGDQDDIAMALKMAELAGGAAAAPSMPTGQMWIVFNDDNDESYGPFATEADALQHQADLQTGGVNSSVYEIKPPGQHPNVPTPTAIQYDPGQGKYVIGSGIANKPAGSLYSNP